MFSHYYTKVKQVIKSLEAVNETILADIKRLENDYQFAFGGDTSTIDKL